MSARQKKALYFQKLQNILEEYNKIFVVEVKHVTSKQVADIRKALRGQALLLFGKKTMIRRCMNKFVEDHPGHPIEKLIPLVHGNVGLVFVNGDMANVREIILNNKVPAPARVGVVAHVDVIVPAGPTGCDPGQTSWFQALNIATKINRGQIEIINDVPLMSYTYDASWNFHLQASSPALSGAATGSEAFAVPYFAAQGLTVNGQTYTSPTVAARFGAFGN